MKFYFWAKSPVYFSGHLWLKKSRSDEGVAHENHRY